MTRLPIAALAMLIAQAAPAPAARYQRAVAVATPGPHRLAVDATLLAGGAPFRVVRRGLEEQRLVAEGGLSDLRFTAADGREVPYLLVYPDVPEPVWLDASVQPIAATGKTSGFEADLGSIQNVDAIALRRSPGAFMKRFSLEASADREHWTQVIPEGTLFEIPERQIRQTQAAFRPGRYRYLRVTWDDTHSGRVSVTDGVVARASAAIPPPPPVTTPLTFERRPSEPGRSRYHVTLPGVSLPLTALRLEVSGGYLFRNVTVTEPHLSAWQAAPVVIGEGLLVRDRDSGPASRIAIRQPSQAELDLLVEDGDNPPLDVRGVSGEFAELPWIYVEAPGPLVAHYGDPALPKPRYDLEAARSRVRLDELPEARWEPPLPPAATAPAAAAIDPASLTGSALDVSSFRYARVIAAGTPQLVALPLDAAVLAHSTGPAREFADVRVVDGQGRQVPRLVERRAEPLVIALRAEPAAPVAADLQPRGGQHRSVYHVTLPYATLPDARLVISTTAAVFQRHVEIGYERPADRGHRDPWFLRIASVQWSRVEDTPSALTVPLSSPIDDASPLTLVVDEGDNSPLPIANVQLLLPSYRLRFVRPASAARLVYGSNVVEAPRYDLALLAPTVLAAPAAEVTMAAEGETKTDATPVPLVSPLMFWAILGAAVCVLLGVLVVVLRKA
jgi:uncharacterized protein DUF3999